MEKGNLKKIIKDNFNGKINKIHLRSLGVTNSVFSIASTIILDLLESNLVKVM